jgi:hypothetical protein
MKDKLFSNDFHTKIKREVEKSYRDFIEDLRDDFKRGFSTDVVDADFLDQLADILQDECFDKYSPLKFYWLNLVDNIVYVIQLHEELLEENDIETDELTELEDELFSFWNASELTESFLNFLNEGAPVIEASNSLLPLLENQIISFYVLHLSLYQQEFDDALMYQTIPELGDSEKKIYLGDTHQFIKLSKKPDTFPALPVLHISPDQKIISIEVLNKPIKFQIENASPSLLVDEHKLFVLPNCELGEKKLEEFKKNITKALSNIKKSSPYLHTTFKSFTHTIVPVNEKGIVSYSIQSLPGYSSINMFDRDQIDLMDDLLHENGHHYLNTFLNHQDLINEDDEKIYYSPWRKALRPIRGIYHATFTFFWALELFYNLDQASEKKVLLFTKEEKIKIKFRFLEEFYMLDYCRTDLAHAYKNKRVTREGNQLVTMIYDKILNYKKDTAIVLEKLKTLSPEKYNEINLIKKDLEKTRAHYKLI